MKKYRGIIVVGSTGTGKSYLIKKLLKKHKGNKLIYDVENEYEGGVMMPMQNFLNIAKNVKNHLILFEEATIFFSNKGDTEEIRYLLIKKRHDNNTIIFVFHTLQQVPLNIMGNCELLILKKTADNVSLVEKKFGKDSALFKAFMLLRKIPSPTFNFNVKLR